MPENCVLNVNVVKEEGRRRRRRKRYGEGRQVFGGMPTHTDTMIRENNDDV